MIDWERGMLAEVIHHVYCEGGDIPKGTSVRVVSEAQSREVTVLLPGGELEIGLDVEDLRPL